MTSNPKVPEVGLPAFADLLARVVRLPSVSSPEPEWDQSNEAVIHELSAWFEELGFSTEISPVPGQSAKFNLVATLGQGSKGLVLSGHSDTVPYDKQKWESDPFELREHGGRYYGLGTCDMKGFFPIIVEALRGLADAPLSEPLIVLATADEESSMSGARALAEQGTLSARAAVIGEPTSIRPVRMHKGIMMECIRVRGRSGHSSNPALGRNAIEDMQYLIAELLQYRNILQARYQNPFFEVSTPTMNLGHVHGGDSPNRICGHCELSFDLRLLPGMNTIELRAQLQNHISEAARQKGIEVECFPLIESVEAFETQAHAELVQICEQQTRQESMAVSFATEAPFLSAMGMETVVMGAGSIDQAHQPNEFLAIDQVQPMASVLRKLISHYCIKSEHSLGVSTGTRH